MTVKSTSDLVTELAERYRRKEISMRDIPSKYRAKVLFMIHGKQSIDQLGAVTK